MTSKLIKLISAITTSVVFLLSITAIAKAQPHPVPFVDGLNHTGVASCATAGCHGDQVTGDGAGPVVGQNEYFQWRSNTEKGAHSRAYEVLLTPHAKRIANNLGVGPAEQAAECLDCHADNVPAAKRSQRFQISDGVGCEACHGGAQNWLAFHRIGAGHEKNIEAGLYPTEDPVARARLCFGCHLGSSYENQFVNHRIMGAGHPRLKFELDLYTTIQKHHRVDADYRDRKTVAPGTQVWAVGQAMALERTLELLIDNNTGRAGAFPELVFFDCHACHQPISNGTNDLDWRPNPGRSLGPGAPILNDANLIMLVAAMRVIDPALATQLENEGRVLHAASQHSGSQFRTAAEALRITAAASAERIMNTDLSNPALVKSVLREIVSADTSRLYTNYTAAEQALFAVQRLSAALDMTDSAITSRIENASNAAQGPYAFQYGAFRSALFEISAQIEQ
ncbi:multiheme c-type cytochrome [Hyphococcus sp. DH-69]|uniref:multiheme c-type cytochrome n=1 Tax=Hyphococcus formosus TaxID=3143534 RepID=UPI00398B9648